LFYSKEDTLDILTVQGLLAMLQIIVIDILLAGDNAIVIGMAGRHPPPPFLPSSQSPMYHSFDFVSL